jgi:UrcA family protein
MKQLLRTLCLPAALLVVSAPVLAQNPAPGSEDITALGRTELRHGWLDLRNADTQDRVVARINTAGLDLTTDSGQNTLARRIDHASADLCRAALDDPEFPGSKVAAERDCIRAAKDQAARQLAPARQASR